MLQTITCVPSRNCDVRFSEKKGMTGRQRYASTGKHNQIERSYLQRRRRERERGPKRDRERVKRERGREKEMNKHCSHCVLFCFLQNIVHADSESFLC
jgi:hypothetical protein